MRGALKTSDVELCLEHGTRAFLALGKSDNYQIVPVDVDDVCDDRNGRMAYKVTYPDQSAIPYVSMPEVVPADELFLTEAAARKAVAEDESRQAAKKASQRKTITRARLDSMGTLHQETFPVVYMNGKLVYYKIPGKDELAHAPLWTVQQDLPAALIMEQLLAGKYSSYGLYWNPAPEARVRALTVPFEATAMAKAASDAEAAELNSRQQEADWHKRHIADKAALAMRRENLDKAKGRWRARLEAQAAAINAAIEASGPMRSVFVHSGEHFYENDDALRSFNYKMALVLSASADGQKRFGRTCLSCRIQFYGRDKYEFTVPDYTLPDLYEEYPGFGHGED